MCVCHETYLGESSESDIPPSLCNQTLSTILKASQNYWILLLESFVFHIFPVQDNIWKVRFENRKSEMRNFKNEKLLEPL